MHCLFYPCCKINFEQVHIQSMTLAPSTLQIGRHEYSEGLNIVIFVAIGTMSFYAINMDFASLFAHIHLGVSIITEPAHEPRYPNKPWVHQGGLKQGRV